MRSILFPLFLAGLLPFPASADEPKVTLQPVWQDVKIPRPVTMAVPADGSNRRFVVEQAGRIILPEKKDKDGKAKVFLDISGRDLIENPFEEGLVGLAFHPKFSENRRFFIFYTIQEPKRSVIAEMLVSANDPDKADAGSERIVMQWEKPFWNHNSGNLLFGSDGMLYIGTGDGGKGNGVHNLSQNLFSLSGKILRIDVDTRHGARQYGIPKDNPFVKADGVRPEIYAWGLRNPWGLAFDAKGRLWCADVGQNLWEEINLIQPGGNYGWNYREGLVRFDLRPDAPPQDAKFIDPIHVYDHTQGISITGGVVYRGKAMPGLAGAYIYADYAYGTVWALRVDDSGKTTSNTVLRAPTPGADFKPTCICEDSDGELLVLSWDGTFSRIQPAP